MCGICGFLESEGKQESKRASIERMCQIIAHRGPDDEGHYLDANAALGMRRLSIIDLAHGHQPICNEDETIWVVLNGEIYNFQALREELESKGHVFRTHSDTEAIVHLYEELGVNLFQRLRGMYGVAIWDTKRKRLVIGRDRIGEKPLYFRREPKRFLFASELKSLLQAEDVPRRLSLPALSQYLSLGYVPAPHCLIEGVEKLLPGHYLVVENNRVEISQYWDVPIASAEEAPEGVWVERLRDKLLETVRAQLISDVPLGAFLSGGLDSSTIVAAMAKMTGKPVKTYSIGYGGDYTYYNELPFASAVAKAFRTDHHEIIVRPEVSELLPKLVWHLDEPIADSACLTTYLVSKLARESVTVILSGVGGDELFGGYRRYLGNTLKRYYTKIPGAMRKKWIPAMLARIPQDRHSSWKDYARYAAAFVKSSELDDAERYIGYVTLFSPAMKRALLSDDARAEAEPFLDQNVLRDCFDHCNDTDSLNRTIYVDLKTSLTDDLLAMTDRMSMAVSIECRAPLVDHELIELAARMPSSLKVRGFTLKYLMKKAVAPWLPKEILHRKKRGFGAPMGGWLRKDIQPMVSDLLSEERTRRRGLFQWPAIQQLIEDHARERRDYTDQLFSLVMLELWCQSYLDADPQMPATNRTACEVADVRRTS